jgi:hypothetical protein
MPIAEPGPNLARPASLAAIIVAVGYVVSSDPRRIDRD